MLDFSLFNPKHFNDFEHEVWIYLCISLVDCDITKS
jgi:hypothetical protein